MQLDSRKHVSGKSGAIQPKVFITLGILKTLCFESNIPAAVLYLVKSKVKVNFSGVYKLLTSEFSSVSLA